MTGGILKHTDALKFILGGNSTFTCLNTNTGNRFTFHVKVSKKEGKKAVDENAFFFVKVLTSPECYQFIGTISKKVFKYSLKSNIDDSAQSVKVFEYVLAKLILGTLPDFIEAWHEGRCGKCGRPLTVPSSIENGLGPECIKTLSKMEKRDNFLKLILG